MPKEKKINNLVIGSDGFVGDALCAYLENLGENVTRFDIKRGAKEDARTAKLPLKKADRVYFLAWEVGGAKYLYQDNTQLHQLNWNIELLRNVMPQLQKYGTPFVFVSSQLAEETDTVYGVTKKLGELWTKQLGGVCVRLWNVYGVLEKTTEKSHVVGDFIEQAVSFGKVKMMTTGEEKRQFIHVQDACRGMRHVIENNMNGKVHDLTSFEWTSVKSVADIVGKHAGAKIIPGKKKGAERRIAILEGKPWGWSPQITLEEGVKMMAEEALLSKNSKPKK